MRPASADYTNDKCIDNSVNSSESNVTTCFSSGLNKGVKSNDLAHFDYVFKYIFEVEVVLENRILAVEFVLFLLLIVVRFSLY